MGNEAFLYNIVFSCFLAALPNFLTVHQQVIVPSGTGRLIYAAWLGRKGRLGDSRGPDQSRGEDQSPFADKAGYETLGDPDESVSPVRQEGEPLSPVSIRRTRRCLGMRTGVWGLTWPQSEFGIWEYFRSHKSAPRALCCITCWEPHLLCALSCSGRAG